MNISDKNPRWWPAPKRSCTPKIAFSSLIALIIGAFMGYWIPTHFGYNGTSCAACPNVTELTEKFTKVEGELKQSQDQVIGLTKQLAETGRKPSEPVSSCPNIPPPSATPTAPYQPCLDTTELAEKLKKLEITLQNKELQVGSLRTNLDGCNSLLEECKSKTCWLDRFHDTVKEMFRNSE